MRCMCNVSIFSCASIASVCPIVPTTPVSARYCSNSNAPSSSGAYVTNLIKFPLASCHCLNCSIFAGTICSSGCAPARFLKHTVLLSEYIQNALLFLSLPSRHVVFASIASGACVIVVGK